MKALLCIQCSMEALAAGRPLAAGMFEQTPEDHTAQYHPDPEATARRRQELEQLLQKQVQTGRIAL